MPNEETVERVARAMAASQGLDWDGKAKGSEYANHGYWLPLARAALAAMGWRDNTKAVKLAFTYAFAAGFKTAEETSRQCIPALDDAWDKYQQIATLPTPPEQST